MFFVLFAQFYVKEYMGGKSKKLKVEGNNNPITIDEPATNGHSHQTRSKKEL